VLRNLQGMNTSCLGIDVLDHRNLVAALSADSEIYIWDISTGLNIMKFAVP
jgi:WD40 repeat protein